MKTKFIFGIFVLFSIISTTLQAQFTCPRGLINCDGQCGRFVDENGDGICDPSEFTPVETKTSVVIEKEESKPKAEKKSIQTKDTAISIPIKIDTIHSDGDTLIEVEVEEIIYNTQVLNSDSKETKKKVKSKPYRLIGISAITLICYVFTMLLVRFKIIRKIIHRKIWNTLLLINFLMSCLLGLLLVVQLNYNILKSIYLTNLKLHVEFGIAMTIIAIIHIFWHLPYFLKLFRKRKDIPN
ncbi:MAG: hypothetical protein PHN41_01890 [Bacteroidales bacterium]|jgi:hypothetical protein|nr:hypothetical protein [Bacteroidales bacterium]MDD4703098.1 hypothetical protein [Bacteroidales bacterium]MDX9798234.1 hypothetical protein [Bacteroidales bacterium]